jgi:hypothetical protein
MASERERARDEQLRRARAEERKAEQDRHQQELDHAQARRRETRRAQRSPQDARVFTGREGESSDNAAVRGVGRDSRARDVSTVPRDNPSVSCFTLCCCWLQLLTLCMSSIGLQRLSPMPKPQRCMLLPLHRAPRHDRLLRKPLLRLVNGTMNPVKSSSALGSDPPVDARAIVITGPAVTRIRA